MRSRAAAVMTGPISDSGSRPGPTLVARAFSATAATSSSAAALRGGRPRRPRRWPCSARPRSRTRRRPGGRRRSRCPRRAARWRGSSPRPGPARACRARGRSRRCTWRSGWSRRTRPRRRPGGSSSASTASLSPCTTLNTPSGSPASAHSSATKFDSDGSRSLGLRTKVLPVAIATGYIHIGTMAGKLNGVIPAQTPSGWRKENRSTPVETWSENSPLSSVGMPQANSMTSRPRCTSPAASDSTLPCSSEMISASSLVRALTSSRNANSTLVRLRQRRLRPRLERGRRGAHGVVDVGGRGRAAPRPAARRWPGSTPGSCAWTCRWRACRRSNG